MPPNSPEQTAKTVFFLLNNSETRKEVAQKGKETVRERFSLSAYIQNYENIYKELLEDLPTRVEES